MHALAVSEQGTSVHAEGDMLVLYRGQTALRRVRVGEIGEVLLFGRIELTAAAMALLLRRGVDVVLLTQNAVFRGRLLGRSSKNVLVRLAQYRRTTDPAFCRQIASAIVVGKIRHQRQVLLRAQRRLQDDQLAVALGQLRLLSDRAGAAAELDTLRGLEGQAAAVYFGQFNKLLQTGEFRFERRTRRPPRDPVNALLSFGYAVLGSVAETEVYRCGLDPLLGFLHQPLYGRPSLMLDLLEEFRPLVDGLVLRVVNRRQLGLGDFVQRSGRELADVLNEESGEVGVSEALGEPVAPGDALPSATSDDHAATGLELPPSPAVAIGESPPWDESLLAVSDGQSLVPAGASGPATAAAAMPLADVDANGEPSEPGADGTGETPGGAGVIGVYLGDVGRKIFLNELFRRLREGLYYPPRDAKLELRDILREQIYHLARVIEGRQERYQPFVPD
ncbi:MAG: CRISPR-associated endonuclease Cas1 [Planctomycetota bacterium]|nr:CRISPR-associated endonuclease Cas1 [Planctomycetota bacterium]